MDRAVIQRLMRNLTIEVSFEPKSDFRLFNSKFELEESEELKELEELEELPLAIPATNSLLYTLAETIFSIGFEVLKVITGSSVSKLIDIIKKELEEPASITLAVGQSFFTPADTTPFVGSGVVVITEPFFFRLAGIKKEKLEESPLTTIAADLFLSTLAKTSFSICFGVLILITGPLFSGLVGIEQILKE